MLECNQLQTTKNLWGGTTSIYPLIAGAEYILVYIKYDILNMLKIKCDINQQDLKTVDLHFVKFE